MIREVGKMLTSEPCRRREIGKNWTLSSGWEKKYESLATIKIDQIFFLNPVTNSKGHCYSYNLRNRNIEDWTWPFARGSPSASRVLEASKIMSVLLRRNWICHAAQTARTFTLNSPWWLSGLGKMSTMKWNTLLLEHVLLISIHIIAIFKVVSENKFHYSNPWLEPTTRWV